MIKEKIKVKKNPSNFKKIHWLCVFTIFLQMLFSTRVHSAVTGNAVAQERGDIEFRQLNIPVDEHGGIYWSYGTGDPTNKNHHLMTELSGPVGFNTITVQSFVDVFGSYYGAYTLNDINLTLQKRQAIINTAFDVRSKIPAITYVLNPINQYIEWDDNLGDCPGVLELKEIEAMRSDAYVEFCYAENNVPILTLGNNIKTQTDLMIFKAGSQLLYPSDQRNRLRASYIDNPEITVLNAIDNNIILDNCVANIKKIKIKVKDISSGPWRLELWQGSPSEGNCLGDNNLTAGIVDKYIYTSSDNDLSELDNLADGNYTIRAYDRAGNDTLHQFKIDTTKPKVQVREAKEDVYNSSSKSISPRGLSESTTVYIMVTEETNGSGIDKIKVWKGKVDVGELIFNKEIEGYVQSDNNFVYTVTECPIFVQVWDKAGNINLFYFEVKDMRPPEVVVRERVGSEVGDIIYRGEVTGSTTVYIMVDDDKYGSGIDKIEVRKDNPDTGEAILPYPDYTNYGQSHTYSVTNLPDKGFIYIKAWDKAGNVTTYDFEVDSIHELETKQPDFMEPGSVLTNIDTINQPGSMKILWWNKIYWPSSFTYCTGVIPIDSQPRVENIDNQTRLYF
ncbi:MAG: hypothetical protein WC955_12730 [Elusimicrobiota bacterium]